VRRYPLDEVGEKKMKRRKMKMKKKEKKREGRPTMIDAVVPS
jgi:hypothetical protein